MHRIRKGLDLPLAGVPQQAIDAARPVERVALLGADTLGLRPALRVAPGERVRRGQPLYEDKKNPGVLFVAPATGTVEAIHRGERRAFLSIVVAVDGEADADASSAQPFAAYRGRPVAALDRSDAVALLVESGLWTALRERPFAHVPAVSGTPRSIFVTAIDTHPHAPDVGVVLAGREQAFADGVALLARLTDGPVYVCTSEAFVPALPDDPRIRRVAFAGPHPAGTPGLHIHLLDPVDAHRRVWYVGCEDVAAMGELVATGRLDVTRVVSIGGPGAARPRLVRTRLGASTDELAAGELRPGPQRVISGSVLGGRTAMGECEGFLGRYHRQVAIVPEATEREMFGYIMPGRDKFSVWNVVLGRFRGVPLPLDTSTNGGPRAMVPIGSYERVMPFDLMPTFLLRALATKDIERAEALGVLELDEEDLALATFVDPGKTEWGPLLRDMLERLRKEEEAEA
ncbi:MAG TPA: Na(+)-translocating NADH-quinone reductase subunit A [Casimicrobiaceae bacterium]|nr:Na(+)-translocating NADH-quinone reductase subunit A [Casimicrobiaceae bacterium]